MEKIYSEKNVTWASIEKDVSYSKVVWLIGKDGIPFFEFIL